MTTSYGIEPARQVGRSTVPKAAAPAQLPPPAAPKGIPTQVGGQLLFAEDPTAVISRNQEKIEAIQKFLGPGGPGDTAWEWAEEAYLKRQQEKADKMIETEALAAQQTTAIANDVNQIQDEETKRRIALKNPWINHYYYSTKAEEAAGSAAIGLETWGKNTARGLAEMEDPSVRSAAIAKKAAELLKPYADIPKAYMAAKVDPLMSQAKVSIQKFVAEEEINLAEEKATQDVVNVLNAKLKKAANIANPMFGNKGLLFSEQALQQAYNDGLATQKKLLPHKGEKFYNSIWFDIAPDLFMDKDGDGYNDLGKKFSYLNYEAALSKVKTESGQKLMTLVRIGSDGRRQTFEEALKYAMYQAANRKSNFERIENQQIYNEQQKFERSYNDDITAFWSKNATPTDEEVTDERNKYLDAVKANPTLLPEGYSVQDFAKYLEKEIPFYNKFLSDTQIAELKRDVDEVVNQRIEFGSMPDELKNAISGTSVYAYAVTEFAKANKNRLDGMDTTIDETVTSLVGKLKGAMESDPDFQALSGNRGKTKTQRKEALTDAVERATPYLEAEATPWITKRINALSAEQRRDKSEIQKILNEAEDHFLTKPKYNDVDNWFNLADTTRIGERVMLPPVGVADEGGLASDGSYAEWKSGVKDLDNRKSWSINARSDFINASIDERRNYVSNRFLFTDQELTEIKQAAITGKMDGLSRKTRESLNNVYYGLGGEIPKAEIIQLQGKRWYEGSGSQMPPKEIWNNNINTIENSVKSPVAGTGTTARDQLLYIEPSNPDNAGITFKTERGNQYQTYNNAPSPFTGDVIQSDYIEGLGNTVVIKATQAGPGYGVGTTMVLSHCATLLVNAGDKVSNGQSLCIAGNIRPTDSGEGSSTGDINPGYLFMQFLDPDTEDYFSGEGALPQQVQSNIFNSNFTNLYQRTNQTGFSNQVVGK